jgi:hypothetical protein
LLRLVEQEATELVNLGTEEERKEVKGGTFMKVEERARLKKLLHDYNDVFA